MGVNWWLFSRRSRRNGRSKRWTRQVRYRAVTTPAGGWAKRGVVFVKLAVGSRSWQGRDGDLRVAYGIRAVGSLGIVLRSAD